MKVLFVIFFTILSFPNPGFMRRKPCLPKYHYWKPYVATGIEPKTALSVGVPKNYTRTYVARVVVPYKKWSRIVPGQLTYDHVETPSFMGKKKSIERIVDDIEVLHVTDTSEYHWLPVYWPDCDIFKPSKECYDNIRWNCHYIRHCCCLVEGGIVWDDKQHHHIDYIGRVVEGGKIHIGRVALEKAPYFEDDVGMYYLNGLTAKRRQNNFDVLSYGCDSKIPNCTSLISKMQENFHKLSGRSRWKL